jgi:hypothetical protein
MMAETTDNLPTSWPDWTAITTDRRPLPDPPADVDEIWTFVYDGHCFGCEKSTEGDRAAVIRWAQGHAECAPPAPPEPILRTPETPVGRIEDLPRNLDGSITIPTPGLWTFGDPS